MVKIPIKIKYKPLPKQKLFHDTQKDNINMVLFGGAVGGAKSHAMVMDAVKYCMKYKGSTATIIRRTFPELQGSIIDKFLEYIPKELYQYKTAEKVAKFINGSQLKFSYLERDADKYRHQGVEYGYIGFDEVTHIVPSAFKYMLSRLRNPYGHPNFLRATANPDGAYKEFVKEYFIDPAPENEVYTDEHGLTRQYIPARLDDNPYLDGETYKKQLAHLPDNERIALLEGSWDFVDQEGAYYAKLLKSRMPMNFEIDTSLPVYTAWDLGIDDATAIWFYQLYANEIRLIHYYENQDEGLQHYINYLHDYRDKKNIVFGMHYAPHDIKVRELSTGQSRLETARSMGINFQVTPMLHVIEGIQAGRNVIQRCYFHVEAENGWKMLKQYRKEFDEKRQVFKNQPLHDFSSHCADAFRYLAVNIRKAGASSSGGKGVTQAKTDNWGVY